MEEDCLTITREAHGRDMKDMLKELWNSSEDYDLTLVCDDKLQIKAHKAVLSACSPVFESIITENSSMIFLPEVEHDEMESILKFIYLGQAKVNQVKVPNFLSLAKNLGIKQMAESTQEKEEKLRKVKKGRARGIKMDNCDICGIKVDTERMSYHKYLRHGNKPNAIYECNQCPLRYSSLTSRKTHIERDHRGIQLKCDQCDYETAYDNRLSIHKLAVHDGQEKLSCTLCSYTADNPRKLQYHNKKHHNIIKEY